MPSRLLRDVLIYAASVVLAYAGGVAFVFLFVAQPGLVDIVSACKIVSLLILIYANREIPEAIKLEREAAVSFANFAVIIVSGLILVMMVLKTVLAPDAVAGFPPAGRSVMTFFEQNSYWVSVIPIFCYVALDLVLAFLRRGSERDRANALEFVVFRDLVCVAPLALVLAISEVYHFSARTDPMARDAVEVFFSGGLAAILLSSAIATKALNRLQHERMVETSLMLAKTAPQESRPHGDALSVVARIGRAG